MSQLKPSNRSWATTDCVHVFCSPCPMGRSLSISVNYAIIHLAGQVCVFGSGEASYPMLPRGPGCWQEVVWRWGHRQEVCRAVAPEEAGLVLQRRRLPPRRRWWGWVRPAPAQVRSRRLVVAEGTAKWPSVQDIIRTRSSDLTWPLWPPITSKQHTALLFTKHAYTHAQCMY